MREEGVALLADSLGGFEQLAPFGIGPVAQARRRGASSMTAPTIYAKALVVNGERERRDALPGSRAAPRRYNHHVAEPSRIFGAEPRTAAAHRDGADASGLGKREAQAWARACSAIGRGCCGARPAGKEQLFSTLHTRGGQIFAATGRSLFRYSSVRGLQDKLRQNR